VIIPQKYVGEAFMDDDSLARTETSATNKSEKGFKISTTAAIGGYAPIKQRITKLGGLLSGLDLSEEHDFTSQTGGGWTIVDPAEKANPKPAKLYEFALEATGEKRTCRIIVLRYKPATGAAGAAGAGAAGEF
jgi:hypothetical protein